MIICLSVKLHSTGKGWLITDKIRVLSFEAQEKNNLPQRLFEEIQCFDFRKLQSIDRTRRNFILGCFPIFPVWLHEHTLSRINCVACFHSGYYCSKKKLKGSVKQNTLLQLHIQCVCSTDVLAAKLVLSSC